jgi:hypothetical protein
LDLDHGRDGAVAVLGEHDVLGGLIDRIGRRAKEAPAGLGVAGRQR